MATNDDILKELKSINKRLDTFEHGQKEIREDVKTVDLKVEAVHEFNKKAHNEIMEKLFESNEINGQELKKLEKRIDKLEEEQISTHKN